VNRAFRIVAVTATIALLGAACSGGGGEKKDAKKSGSTTTTTKAKAVPVAPLTGLPDPTGVAQTRPLLSVKIENTPEARPQTGLELADVVWNEVVEGQITRFLAMFQSRTTDVVGPIRSVRKTDPLIVWPVGGIFAYSGGAPGIVAAIQQAPVKLVDENTAGAAMFRNNSQRAPHNLYGHPDALWAFGGTPVPPPPLFKYLATGKKAKGTPTLAAAIAYRGVYQVSYTWDATSGTWLRTTNGERFLARSGVQIAPQNVIIIPVTYTGGVGNEGAEAQIVGRGRAIVLSGGTAIDGVWVRHDKTQPMEFRTTDETPIRLVPGSTWVELPDVSYPVTLVAAPTPSTTKG
jgi:Protein of unknown function (DUF3048) N-terminal domain/Protein of unknown function (DUF3048) C-terminal domain